VGRASSVLRARALAFAALAALLVVYYYVHPRLWEAGLGWDVAYVGAVLMPAVFGLVYLALPLRRSDGLLLVGGAAALLAFVLERLDWNVAANFAKLAAVTLIAFWFLSIFEALSWVVLVACVIPAVDAWSVWRGPTKHIVTERREVFSAFSFAFPLPGERAAANLGLPDFLFFAVFLAAADRWRLRVGPTWAAMVGSFVLTMVLAVYTDLFGGIGGLPALPLLSVAFLLVNADIFWHRFRDWRATRPQAGYPE
jgi:hypothetical protein